VGGLDATYTNEKLRQGPNMLDGLAVNHIGINDLLRREAVAVQQEPPMPRRTMNVYYRDGYPARVVADDPTLRDVEINFINNDTPDRLMLVAMIAESEIKRYCADQKACRTNTQWHGLSIAVECVGECLIAMRDQHYGDPVAMNAAIDDILGRFNEAREQAMELHNSPDKAADHASATRARFAPESPQPRKTNGKQAAEQKSAVN